MEDMMNKLLFAAVGLSFAANLFCAATSRAQTAEAYCPNNPKGFQWSLEVTANQDFTTPRVTLLCPTNGQISYFAFEIDKNPTAAQMLQNQLSVARAANQNVNVVYNTIPKTIPGCGGTNCRELVSILTGP
jgi:hypothetical protein